MENLMEMPVATVADYTTDTRLDSGTRAFLKLLNAGGVPVESLSVPDARNVLATAQSSATVDYSGIEVSEKTIEADGYKVLLHIIRPEGVSGTLPVFVFLHGGGWVLGDFPTHKRLVRDLVVASGYAAVFVDYTPSPEAQYPQAVNEIYAAVKWVAAHGSEINVDGSKLAVVGNSVGGNMTTVTAIKAKENNGPHISLQLMLWPIVDAGFDTESYREFGEDRFLTTSLMKWLYDNYTADLRQRAEIYASPLLATTAQLTGLPPAVIITAENDVLRDEGEAYGRRLDEAGVPVTVVRYNGMIHDFGMLNALAYLPATRSMILYAAAELKKYLG